MAVPSMWLDAIVFHIVTALDRPIRHPREASTRRLRWELQVASSIGYRPAIRRCRDVRSKKQVISSSCRWSYASRVRAEACGDRSTPVSEARKASNGPHKPVQPASRTS
jgi:hypothetical protein